jgi:hypothetical protein
MTGEGQSAQSCSRSGRTIQKLRFHKLTASAWWTPSYFNWTVLQAHYFHITYALIFENN